jgi:LacI family transcriptional regulator
MTSGPDRPEARAVPGAVGMKDVAKHAGVSVTTVSNVLNATNRISAGTRERVLASVRELGYVRNAAAHQLRSGRSTTVGLIVPEGGNPFYSGVTRGAEDAAAERQLTVLTGNSGQDPARETRYVELFEEQRVLGILIAPVGDTSARVQWLRERGAHVVVLGRVAQPIPCHSVSIDNLTGGYLAAKHLLDSGRRTIGFVGSVTTPGAADRYSGARLAVAEVASAALQVLEPAAPTVAAGREVGQEILRRSGGARASAEVLDAVFCANDLLATGLLHSVLSHLRVPEDLAIIGYDDIDFASSAIVPLSSIRQPAELIGRTAVDLLERELVAGRPPYRHVLLPPELVVRESSSAVGAAARRGSAARQDSDS